MFFSFSLLILGPEKELLNTTEQSTKQSVLENKSDDLLLIEQLKKEKDLEKGYVRNKDGTCPINTDDENPVIYLTFDDGPSKYTDEIIEVLSEYRVQGTFFFLGVNLKQLSEESLVSLRDNCHSVGSHSMTHDKKKLYDQKLFIEENKQMFKLLGDLGYNTNILRAPYGSTYLREKDVKAIKDEGWILLDWDLDSLDWKFLDSKKTYNKIIKDLNHLEKSNLKTINILMHERETTGDLLNLLIPELKKRGYLLLSGESLPYKELIFKTKKK